MPKSCCVTFCTTNKVKNPELKFILLPRKDTEPIRRTKWLQAIRRKDDCGRLWNPSTQHVYVCSLHFVTGLKHEDKTHPDYTPSLFPNRGTSQSSAATKVQRVNRFNRRRKREHVLFVNQSKAATPTPTAQQATSVPSPEHQTQPEELAHSEAPVPLQDGAHNLEKQLHEEICSLRRERDELARQVELLRFSTNCVRDDDTACKTMTGLSWTLFESLHQFLVKFLKTSAHAQFKLPTEDQLFVTLVKLRQNPSNSLMCRVLGLAETTYLDMFSQWLDVMYAKLAFLIAWPERECIRKTIPAQVLLQYPRLTSIIDCFEIRIEDSKKLKTKSLISPKAGEGEHQMFTL